MKRASVGSLYVSNQGLYLHRPMHGGVSESGARSHLLPQLGLEPICTPLDQVFGLFPRYVTIKFVEDFGPRRTRHDGRDVERGKESDERGRYPLCVGVRVGQTGVSKRGEANGIPTRVISLEWEDGSGTQPIQPNTTQPIQPPNTTTPTLTADDPPYPPPPMHHWVRVQHPQELPL